MRRKPRPTNKAGKIVALILLAAVLFLVVNHLWSRYLRERRISPRREVTNYFQLSDRVDHAMKEALEELGASPSFVTQSEIDMEEEGCRWRYRQIEVRVTAQVSLLRCNLAITEAVQEAGGQVLSVEQRQGGDRLTMELGVEGLRTHLLEITSDEKLFPTRGRLAIIIDDFGAINNQVADSFIQLPITLTVAVIPGHETSQQIARQAAVEGHQVLVHLPMQPKEGELGEENGILVDLSEEEIHRRVKWALAEIPGAVGVNNHMGSLATEDKRVMQAVLEEIKSANKFFVDSRTSSQSVALQVAEELRLSCTKSDGFLDDQDNGVQIKERLEVLADKALKEGSAIGIGHIRANTLQALREMIPRLERKGVRFTHVSQVFKARR